MDIYTDRKPEEILTFDFLDRKGEIMKNEILMESSSKDVDQSNLRSPFMAFHK